MFSWMSGRSAESNLPPPTALQAQRDAQIQQLKIFNQNVSEIQRDVEYLVKCTINATTISLHIALPPDFPQEKPTVTVTPPLTHPWVNDHMHVTGCPGINNFMVHSDLGKVIREIVEEFRRISPVLHAQHTVPISRYASPSRLADFPITGVPSGYQGYMKPSQLAGPSDSTHSALYGLNVATDFPQLHTMGVQELREIAEDEERQLDIVSQLPDIIQLTATRADLCGRNEELARENLAKKPVFEERKKCVLEKFEALSDLRCQFDQHSHRQDVLRKQLSVGHLEDILRVGTVEADEAAEAIAESFLDRKLPLNDFLKKFMETKTLAHLRRVKAEKLSQNGVRNHHTA